MTQAVGKYVLLETIDINDQLNANGFYMPSSTFSNSRLAKYKVLSVGNIAKTEYGITEGSIVYADRLACLNWRSKTPFIEYTNIIYGYDEETNNYVPFNNMIIVRSDEQFFKNSSTTFVYKDRALPCGTVIESNSKKFAKGDTVLLPLGGDVIEIGDIILHVYNDSLINTMVIPDEN